MKLDIPNYLKSLKISVARSGEHCNTNVAYRCKCPLHADIGSSMRIIEGGNGVVNFRCNDPSCRFNGDAISLYAEINRMSIADAVQRFMPGGEMACTLSEPIREVEARAYMDNRTTQVRIKAFLLKCQQALRRNPEKCGLRAGLTQTSLKLIPAEIGLLLVDDTMPDEFYEFRKSKYKKSTLIVYPYTCNGDVTHVDVYDATVGITTHNRHTVVISRADSGVFIEDYDQIKRRLLVANDARCAAIMYGNWVTDSSKQPPVTAIAGFPLPETMSYVTSLRYISTSDNPLPLETAIQAICAPEIIAGSLNQPLVNVWVTQKRLDEMGHFDLFNALDHNFNNMYSIVGYACREMNNMYEAGKMSELTSVLSRNAVPDSFRQIFAAEIVKMGFSPDLAALVSAPSGTVATDIVLGNGRAIKSRATEICAVDRRGHVETLCNVGISVNGKIRSYTGNEVLVCTVTPSDSDIQPARVEFPEKSWNSPCKLKRIVEKAFAARGQSPYIAFYELRNYSWEDVLGKLSERCPISQEVAELGMDDTSDLHLPECVIRTSTRKVMPQTSIFTLPDCTLRAYSGIRWTSSIDCMSPFRRLIENCDNLYVAAFTCGLMHVIYQMSYMLYSTGAGRRQAQRHMFYVDTEGGIWDMIFAQLAELLSGDRFVPTISYADPASTLSGYSQLGTLPLVAYIPSMGNKLSTAIDNSNVNVIGLVDSTTAVMINGHVASTFITPSDEHPVKSVSIASEHITELRDAFADFMLVYLLNAKIDSAYRTARIPAVAAFSECCRILGVDGRTIDGIARTYFPGVGMTGVNTFFDMLRRGIMDDRKSMHVCVLNEAPQKGYSFTGRGQHVFVMKDCVLIGHNVVDLVNKSGESTFAIDQLSQEFRERRLVSDIPDELGIDPDRCWCIPRDVWQDSVVRHPIYLPDTVTPGKTIQLKEIE